MASGSPEQSLREIQELIRKLDPSSTSHKDRIRKVTRFRNYVSTGAPEFYDDDIPLLLLGKESNYSDAGAMVGSTGLLLACGSSATDPKPGSMLKRSAPHVMSLLKYLVCDHLDFLDGEKVMPAKDPDTGEAELNMFAHALCCCTPAQLGHMKLHWHMESEGKGGSKEDACAVAVLLLTRHLSPDGGGKASPLALETLIPGPKARKAFDIWLTSRGGPSKDVQKKIKMLQSQVQKQGDNDDGNPTIEVGLDGAPTTTFESAGGQDMTNPLNIARGGAGGGPLSPGGGAYGGHDAPPGVATRWNQSSLSEGKSFKLTKITTALLENEFDDDHYHHHSAADDEDEEGKTRAQLKEEKKKILYRDPLGVRGEELDLRQYQRNIGAMVASMQEEFEDMAKEEDRKKRSSATDAEDIYSNKGLNKLLSAKARKEALDAAVTGEARKKREQGLKGKGGGPTGNEKESRISAAKGLVSGSILTTDNAFDPLLFLSLVHGSTALDSLQTGLDRLDNTTDNQEVRLQSLVRENFGLFLRCTNGVDVFEGGVEDETQIWARIDKMEKLSSNCVYQAKKSFTSLLENTNEVRKTQSALAVLDRMRPILEAPTLMRNHLEAGRFTAAVKAYRRVLVVEENCKVELLRQVKLKATEIARMAQKDLEKAIADPNVNVSTLLDAIRDLQELQSLHVSQTSAPDAGSKVAATNTKYDEEKKGEKDDSWKSKKATEVVKTYPPALACLLLQCKHFLNIVERDVQRVEQSVNDITQKALSNNDGDASTVTTASSTTGGDNMDDKHRWRYDILEARVVATVQAVGVTKSWLPRLVRIGVSAREAEKRGGSSGFGGGMGLTAFDVYVTTVAPAVIRLVEHATFCSLGCSNSGNTNDLDIPMSFGHGADEKVRTLLRAPLPAALSAKCATELAEMVDVVHTFATSAGHFRIPSRNSTEATAGNKSKLPDGPLVACVSMAENAVVTAERRRCIYAFDACGRSSAMNASSRGAFDGDVLLQCVQKLSEELTRPQYCANEIERGCQLVVRRCCEGLASYVRERGTAARLRAVSVCANAISGKMLDVVRDVSYLTGGQSEDVEELLGDDLESLEGVLFEEFLESVNRNVTNCVRTGLSDLSIVGATMNGKMVFPSYLSSSLLAITRCRAQVEKALGDATRRSAGKSYQQLAVVSASESMVFGMCNEIMGKLSSNRSANVMTVKQADQLANELQFVLSTLKNHLGNKAQKAGSLCLNALCQKAERSGGPGTGPDGLATVENLERLGRVYTLCLAEM
jgi:hypothetical protein